MQLREITHPTQFTQLQHKNAVEVPKKIDNVKCKNHLISAATFTYWGDLLRSVLNIKNGVEIKSHHYIEDMG